MIKSILAAGALVAVAAVWPGPSNAQVSCESYMEIVKEKLDALPADKAAKAMEHMKLAEEAQAENNEDRCIEELQLANQEIEAL